jgi:hypothetical protein
MGWQGRRRRRGRRCAAGGPPPAWDPLRPGRNLRYSIIRPTAPGQSAACSTGILENLERRPVRSTVVFCRLGLVRERRCRIYAVLAAGVSIVAGWSLCPGIIGAPIASAAPGVSVSAAGSWQVVSVPSPPGSHSSLAAVSGSSPSDVWAVGESLSKSGSRLITLTEHFDGHVWTVVPSPTLGGASQLSGVKAISADDVWAVGVGSSAQGNVPILLHWNGQAWRLRAGAFSSPGVLRAVSATSPQDVWAVGSSSSGSSEHTLIEHFNGTRWTVVPSPTPDGSDQLAGVTAVASNDAWAVGSSLSSTHQSQTLRERWDGTVWTVVHVKDQGSTLDAVGATSAGNVWAVGVGASIHDSLGVHFDGTRWTVVPTPTPSAIINFLFGVSVDAIQDAWAVGASYQDGLHQVIDHWDGTSWQSSFFGSLGLIAGVTTRPGGGTWAVGATGTGTLVTPFAAFHS